MSEHPAASAGFSLDVGREGSVTVLALRGSITTEHAEALEQRCAALIAEGSPRIVVDLSDLHYVNSAGLAVFIEAHRSCRDRGGRLVLSHPRDAIAQLLRVTHLDRLFEVFPDVATARRSLEAPA